MWWLLPILILPFVELWTLLEVGATVGVGFTLVWCVAALFLGLAVVRYARRRIVTRLQRGAPNNPAWSQAPRPVFEDVLLLAAGGLIAFPGLVSDVLGVLLLLPLVRRALTYWAARRVAGGRHRERVRPTSSRPARGGPVAQDVEIYPPGQIRGPTRPRPVIIDVD